MTDVERVHDAEERLRADLRRTLVPPPTPARLYVAVDKLALDPPPADRTPGGILANPGGRRVLQAAVGIAAVVALAVGLLALAQVRNRQQVATTPHPTLPAVIAAPLPSPAAKPTLLASGAWVDASVVWTVDARGNLRISEDGGQSWSEARPMPQPQDVGFGMFDAHRGYVGMALRQGDADHLSIALTADGGRTWSSPMIQVGTVATVGDDSGLAANVHFVDPDHGVFLATTFDDGPARASNPNRNCSAFETDDGGKTWVATEGGACMTVAGVLWSSPVLGVIVNGTTSPEVSLTLDGGRSWSFAAVPVPVDTIAFAPLLVAASMSQPVRLLGTTFASDSIGQQVYETNPLGGTPWAPAYQPAGLPQINPGLAQALDGDHWLAVAPHEPLDGMDLYESWDAGRAWTLVSHAAVQPGTMRWFDRLHGTVQGVPVSCPEPGASDAGSCGGNGTILLTNDGGQSWHQVPF